MELPPELDPEGRFFFYLSYLKFKYLKIGKKKIFYVKLFFLFLAYKI